MTLWSRFGSWLRTILWRSRMESDMDTELRFHIETFAEDLVRGCLARTRCSGHDWSLGESSKRKKNAVKRGV
jgi:hypothetical protein